ncbi:hypothetical protein AB990_01090 [Alkalihalobacillus pseudalcaliphilus]|nr:hypothetical protein AB990_01090 [Alkalihalobacillus pseudalcaliphilus]
MSKVLYIPLDERPCNLLYPQALAKMTDVTMLVPGRDILGDMKAPAQVDQVINWLKQNVADADYAIISLDMLLYGGIVPSRLHTDSQEDGLNRLLVLKELKKKNPTLKLLVYDLIMRVPAYSSSEEEPDYYEEYGAQIHRIGWLTDKQGQKLSSDEELRELQHLQKEIPESIWSDYTKRRKQNAWITKQALQLVEEACIDYMIIPLDDNAEYGFSAMEQRQLAYEIEDRNLMDQVAVYPGADEIACTLFARAFCDIKDYVPEISLRYSSIHGPFVIPRYEDRSLGESIKAHITAAGGVIVADEMKNDFLLMVHAPARGPKEMAESSFPYKERNRSYISEVNHRELVQAMKFFTSKGVKVALADVAICNGADHSLLKQLHKVNLLETLIAYAGWNTSGNTLGTVISHSIIHAYYQRNLIEQVKGFEEEERKFYYSRLIEDWGYQAIVRKFISYEFLPTIGLTARNLGGQVEEVTELIKEKLEEFVATYLEDLRYGRVELEHVYLPWRRMFEVGLSVNYEK